MDRVIHIPDVSVLASQTVPISAVIGPGVLPRLRTLASAYQRIRYLSLQFVVEPQISTAASGGYVAAFIKDATDTPAGPGALNVLTAQAGSRTTKWWESVTVGCGSLPDLYYTSPDLSERRWSSPGIFALGVDGKCSIRDAPLTVYCRYSVELSEPSLEEELGSYIKPVVEPTSDLRIRAGSYLIETVDGKSENTAVIPGSQLGYLYKLQTPRLYVDEQARGVGFAYVRVNASNGHVEPATPKGDAIPQNSKSEVLVVTAGEPLALIKGEVQRASEYLCVNQTQRDFEIL